jgi:ankyrin repeat protein
MTSLCVPYYNSEAASKYLLYTVTFEKRDKPPNWNVNGLESDPATGKKIRGLQDYFEKRYYSHEYPGKFQMEAENKLLPAKDKFLQVLNEQTPSVFLGLFLKAAQQIQRYEFKSEWQIICATGDIKYDEITGKLSIVSIGEADKKFNGEFMQYADGNKQENYLFIYVSDKITVPEGEKQGKHGNITVKCFSPDNTIEDIIGYVFKPVTFDFNFSGFEPEQQRLLRNMENENGLDFGYIPGEGFADLEQRMLYDMKWCGFFIHGEGGSGKSAAAMAIARYLTWLGKIYAPVWIKINNDEVSKIIEKESIKRIEDIKEKNIDKLEEYITSRIDAQTGQKTKNKYLLVIDNIELQDNGIKRLLAVIQNKISNFENKPYLIITSRTNCGDSELLSRLNLQEEKAPELNREQIVLFVKNIASQKGAKYSHEITTAEERNTFNELAELLFTQFGGFPDMIISAIGLLQNMTVEELTKEIGASLEKDKKKLMIYQTIFGFLGKKEKEVLYIILEIGADVTFSVDDMYQRIIEHQYWRKKAILEKDELRNILYTLFRYNLIYSTSSEGKTLYGIKSIAHRTFLFEKEFIGDKSFFGVYQRDYFVNLGPQLEYALQYNQNADIIRSIVRKIPKKFLKKHSCRYIALAAYYSTDPKNLSLLIDYGCVIDACDEAGDNVFFHAIRNNNFIILNWLFEYVPELINCTNNNRTTVFFAAVIKGNIVLLDWLFERVPELINHTDNNGHTVFHYASFQKDTVVLDWLYRYAPNLLKNINNIGSTVFHYAAGNNTIILDWLFARVPELLKYRDNYGNTVFYYAKDIRIMDWLFNHNPELLSCKDNEGGTVFHYKAAFGNTEQLNWLFAHVPELLSCKDNNGLTVFHGAQMGNNVKILDWLYEHVPELLKCKTNNGATVFHLAAAYNDNIVLDWLLKHTPELLRCKANEGQTIFHWAAGFNKNTTVLDWLFEHVPELITVNNNDGYTVFHHAIGNKNTVALDWLSKRKSGYWWRKNYL